MIKFDQDAQLREAERRAEMHAQAARRERIARSALTGLLAHHGGIELPGVPECALDKAIREHARYAVLIADALIAALDAPAEPPHD